MQGIRTAHGIHSRGVETIWGKRIVMAIDDNDKVLAQKGLHCSRLDGVYADGDETLPEISARERVGPGRVDDSLWHLNGIDGFR